MTKEASSETTPLLLFVRREGFETTRHDFVRSPNERANPQFLA